MCYTAHDSLLALIVGSVSSLALFFVSSDTQYKAIALFLLFVTTMQAFDYVFWTNPRCADANAGATKLAILFNNIQPFVLFGIQHMYGFKQSLLSSVLLGLYGLASLPYTAQALETVRCTVPRYGLLRWDWNHLPGSQVVYALFFFYLLTASFNFTSAHVQYLMAYLGAASIVLGYFTPVLKNSLGRIWCYYTSFIPLLVMLVKFWFA